MITTKTIHGFSDLSIKIYLICITIYRELTYLLITRK